MGGGSQTEWMLLMKTLEKKQRVESKHNSIKEFVTKFTHYANVILTSEYHIRI